MNNTTTLLTIICCVMLLQAASNGERIKLNNPLQCTTKCSASTDVYTFTEGKDFLYDLESKHSYTNASGSKATFVIKGQVRLQALSRCEFGLQLEVSELKETVEPGSVSNDYASFKEELQGRPLRFGFDNGKVTALCPERAESEKALNLKRGILSALQITLDDLQTPSYHIERDISGDCFTEYRIGATNNDLIEIEKSKNIAGCANRFSYSSNSAGILNDQPKETSQAPLIEGDQLCKYKINKRGPLQSVSCTENNLVNPIFEGKGTSIVVEHSLQYVKNEAKKQVEIKPESRTDLLFEAPSEFPNLYSDLRDIKAPAVISLLTNAASQVNSRSSSQSFLRLVFALRQLNEKDIQAVQASATSSESKALFFDALAATQTDASVTVLLKALTNPAEEEFVQGFLLSANFIKKPSAKIITEIQTLYDNVKYRNLALLLSSGLIKKHCSQSPSCFKNKEIIAAFSRIEAQVRTGCSGSNADQALSSWKALGNIGNFPGENTKELLTLCKTNFANQLDVQIAAVEAVQKLSCSFDDVNKFLAATFESDLDTELRIKAYLSLVRCPQDDVLKNIFKVLREDKNQQVTGFVWSHLAGVSTCSDPAKAQLKKVLAPYLNELAALSARLNLDSLSHSKYYEKTYRINQETETNVQSSVIFGQKSFIPQFTNLNVTLNLYGRAINLFDVGVSTSGLESLFNQAKQALTRQSDVIAETLAKEFKSFDGKYTAKSAPSVGISLKIFGSEVLFVKDILTNTKTANVVQQIYQLLSGKAMNINFRRNLFLSDSGVTFPAISGFPLQIQMFAASTLDLAVQAQFQLDSLKIETKLSPKVSVYSVTRYLLNTGFNSLGLTSEVNIHSNTTLETGFELANRASTEGRKLRVFVGPIPESRNILSVRRQVTQNFGPNENFQLGQFSSINAPQKCSGKSLEAVFGGTICVAYKRAISNVAVSEVAQQSFFYEISIVNFVGYIFHLEHKQGTKSTTLPERFILQAGLLNDANRMILFNFTEISNGYSFDTNIPYVGRYALNAAWQKENVLEGELQKDGKGLIKLKGFMDGTKTRWVLRDEKEDWMVFQLEDGKTDSSKSLEFTLKKGFPFTLKMSTQNFPERVRNVISLKLGEDYKLKWEFSSTTGFQLNKKNEWNTQFEWKKKDKTLIEYDGRIDLERRDGLSAQVAGVAGKLFSISVSNKFEGEVADKKSKFAQSTGFSVFASNGLLKGGAVNLDEPVVLESEFNWRYPEKPKRNINYSLFTYLKKPTQANGNFTFLFEGKVPEGLALSSFRHFAQLAWKSGKFPFDEINFQLQSDNVFGQKFTLHFNHEVNFPKSVLSAFKLDGFGFNLVVKSQVTDLKAHSLMIKCQGVNILLKTEIRFERTSAMIVELKHKLFVEKDQFGQGTTNLKWEGSGPINIDVAFKLTKLNGDFNFNAKLYPNKDFTKFANQGIETAILLSVPSRQIYFKNEFNLRENSNAFNSKWALQLTDEKPAKRMGYDLSVNMGDIDVLSAISLTILLPRKEYQAVDISISRIPMKDYRLRFFSLNGDEISYIAKLLPSNDPNVIPIMEKFVFDLSATFSGIYYESEREQVVKMSPSKTKIRVDINGKDKTGSKTAEWCKYKLEQNFEFEGGAIKFSLKYSHDFLTKYLGLTETEFALDIVPPKNSIMQLTALLSWRLQNQAENQFVKTTLEWEANAEERQYGFTGKVDIKILDRNYSLKVKDTVKWNGVEFDSKMVFNWKSNSNDFQLSTNIKFANLKNYKLEITTNSAVFRTLTLSSELEEKNVKTLTKKFNFDIAESKFDLKFKFTYGRGFNFGWKSNIKVIENVQIDGSWEKATNSLNSKWTEAGSRPRWFAFNVSDTTVATQRKSEVSFRSEFGTTVTSVWNIERSTEGVNIKLNGNFNIDKIYELKLDQFYFILASQGKASSLGYTLTMNGNTGSPMKLFEKATLSWKYDAQRLAFINFTDVVRYNDALLSDFVLDTALGKFVWELDLSKFMPPNASKGIYISLLLPTWDINDFSFTGTLQLNPFVAKTFLKVDLFNGFFNNAVRNDPQGGPTKFLLGLDLDTDYPVVDRLYSYFSIGQKEGNKQKADFYYEFASNLLAAPLKGYYTSEVTQSDTGIEATLKANGVSAYSVSSTWKAKEFTFALKDIKGVKVPISFEVQHDNSWFPLKWTLEVTQLGKLKGSIKSSSKAGFKDFSVVYEMNNNAGVIDIGGSYSGLKDFSVIGKVTKIQGVTFTATAQSKAFTTPSSTSGIDFTLSTELEYEKWSCNKCEMKTEYKGSFFDSEMSVITRVNGLDRLRYSEEIRLVKFENMVVRAALIYPDLTEMSFDIQRTLREGRMSFKISNFQFEWNLIHDYTSALLSSFLQVGNRRYQFRTNLQRIAHVAARRAYYDANLSMYDNILPIGFGYTLQLNEGYLNFTRETSNKINLRAFHPSFPGQPILITMQYEIQPTIKFTLTGKTPFQKVKELLFNFNIDLTAPSFIVALNYQDAAGQWTKQSIKLESVDESYRLSVDHTCSQFELKSFVAYDVGTMKISHKFDLTESQFNKKIYASESECTPASLLIYKSGVCELKVNNGEKLRILSLRLNDDSGTSSVEFAWDKEKYGTLVLSTKSEISGNYLLKNFTLLSPVRNLYLQGKFYTNAPAFLPASVSLYVNHHSGRADKTGHFQLDYAMTPQGLDLTFSSNMIQEPIVTSFESAAGNEFKLSIRFKNNPKPFFVNSYKIIFDAKMTLKVPIFLSMNNKQWNAEFFLDNNAPNFKLYFQVFGSQPQIYAIEYNPMQNFLIQAGDSFLFQVSFFKESFSSVVNTALKYEPDSQVANMTYESSVAPFKFVWRLNTNTRSWKFNLRAVSKRAYMASLSQVTADGTKLQDATFHSQYDLNNLLKWELTWRKEFIDEYKTFFFDATNPSRLSRILSYYQAAIAERRGYFLSEFGRPFVTSLNIGTIIDFVKSIVNDVEDSWKELGRIYENNDFFLKSIFGKVGQSSPLYVFFNLPKYIQMGEIGQVNISKPVEFFKQVHQTVRDLFSGLNMQKIEGCLQLLTNAYSKFLQLIQVYANSGQSSASRWTSNLDFGGAFRAFTKLLASVISDDAWAYLSELLQEAVVMFGQFNVEGLNSGVTATVTSLKQLREDVAKFFADVQELVTVIYGGSYSTKKDATPTPTPSYKPEININTQAGKITFQSYVSPSAFAVLSGLKFFSEYVPNELVNTAFKPSYSMETLFYRGEYLFSRYGSKSKALSFLPPYSKSAWILKNRYYITYDGASGHVVPGCRYLLSRDFDNQRFSIVLEAKDAETSNLFIQINDRSYQISSTGQVSKVKSGTTDLEPKHLPYAEHDNHIKVERDGQRVRLTWKHFLTVDLYTLRSAWSISLAGVLQGQVDGLLGSNNAHLNDDYLSSGGSVADDNTARLKSWTSGECSALNANKISFPQAKGTHFDCRDLFESPKSHLSRCFNVIDPRPYRDICYTYAAPRSSEEIQNHLCMIENAYVLDCQQREISVRMCPKCTKCGITREGDSIASIAPKSNRFIFIVEKSSCVEAELPFIKKLANGLKGGNPEDQFTLITFDSDKVSHVTLGYTGTQGSAKDLEIALDNIAKATIKEVSTVNTRGLEAIFKATLLQTKKDFRDQILLFTCTSCAENRKYPSVSVQNALTYSGIPLHHFSSGEFISGGIDGIVGLDANKFYRNSGGFKEGEKTVSMRPPKGECTSLAAPSKGAVWSLSRAKEVIVPIYERIKKGIALNSLKSTCQCRTDQYGSAELECRHIS